MSGGGRSGGRGEYVELHCHSSFSLLDGASSPEALVARAAALGYPALALTDHDDLGGIVRFAEAAKEAGIGGIVGVELTVEGERRASSVERVDVDARDAPTSARSSLDARRSPSPASHHLILLAESREGYGNLSTLVTRARMDRQRGSPAVSLDLVARHAAGLFALTGCPRGWVPSLVARGDLAGARAAAGTLAEIFEGRLAIECWDHHLPEEGLVVREMITLSRAIGVPWVVTNDVHYATAGGRVVHDVLSCLRHGRTLDEMGTRLRPSGEWHLRSAAQMRRRWRQDDAGVRATLAVAERCAFRMEHLRPSLPTFPTPPGVTADEYLEALVEEGARERYGGRESGVGNGETARSVRGEMEHAGHPAPRTPRPAPRTSLPTPHSPLPALELRRTVEHDRQIAHELSIIRRLGLAGYFLIVWDIVRFARREGILCQGRGSAANSVVCYCLGITAVDPIRMELLFERFLSEERQEAPDIDLDFAHRERERVIQYVYERYGRERAAMVCEQITYRGKSAVRDAARVLGFSTEQADALSALSDRFSARATAAALRGEKGASGMGNGEWGVGSAASGVGSGESGVGDSPLPTPHSRSLRSADTIALAAVTDAPPRAPRSVDGHLADTLGQAMVRGTEATTRARAEKHAAREAAKQVARPLTPADRPKPNAAYEPYGSPSAQHTHGNWWEDPHAPTGHVERRNPTTALRPTTPAEAPDDSLVARAGLDPSDRRVRVLAEVVDGLHQAPRHRSIHVGGFVLTEEPLPTVVPIEPASMPGRTVIQWEKDDLEPVGLVKIDLLGLGMLTVLQDCLRYVRETRGVALDLGALDTDDGAVYDDLCRADTIGVFQVESRAQQNTLPRLKPRCFYDLVIEVALIRPGPIQGDMVHPFLRRRAGTEPVTYPHPALEPILRRTLGVPLFQEQGMQVAIACAGFSAGEADNLRRAMGHKRSRERMAEICERLVSGMARNGIPEETARKIYNQINAFADYGFPESHAASFALLVYASAYLRHHYHPEYLAAMLNAQPMGFYAPGTLVEDAKRHGVKVLPVDLTRSGWDATLEYEGPEAERGMRNEGRDATRSFPSLIPHSSFRPSEAPAVRLGLRSVRGLGARARERLEAALAGGPFTSPSDVVARSGLDRRGLRLLAEAGAFDAFFPDEPVPRKRRAALWRMLADFRGDAGPLAPQPPLPTPHSLPEMSQPELTEADYRLTGISLLGHPMRHLRDVLRLNGVRTARDLLEHGRDGERAAIAGLVICRQRPGTARGFVFLSLEDETGIVNVVVTPKRFERQALLISTSPLLLVRGTLQVEGRVVNLRGDVFRQLTAGVGEEHARGHDFH